MTFQTPTQPPRTTPSAPPAHRHGQGARS
ncbi:Protein of unknown function [Propionibacterium freudenreichii]|nr:Protein of unknown function [Propionibacterium freudenreichii]